ncbi:hypothetical protein FRAAL2578 [Frankia alni ACN14a]|uniref:Uncharacterized protein n=1 Tax=Frankia alni (strain DSM 45986 / CECT 9034 / ACN14a) TaxID=326424 RepID=Q0RMM2_FRAAA|nr:hypothetical protein FRAAL2578 [Frankia alni ACN14a]
MTAFIGVNTNAFTRMVNKGDDGLSGWNWMAPLDLVGSASDGSYCGASGPPGSSPPRLTSLPDTGPIRQVNVQVTTQIGVLEPHPG